MPTSTTQKPNTSAAQWTTEYVNNLPDSSFAYVDASGERHLPYKAADGTVSLPQVRNSLAKLADDAGIPSDKKADIRATLQTSMQASESIDYRLQSIHAIQASADGALPTEVMLLRAGTFQTQKYGTVPIKSESLPEFKANFDKGLGMADQGQTGLPVDFAHQSHLNAGAWIKGMEVRGDELWGTKLEFSDSGKQAILGKEYKCLSSDFYPESFGEWVDPESGITAKNVFVGAAFTNRPLFTGNQPVIASETAGESGQDNSKVIYVIANQEKETSMNIDQLRVKAADDVTGPEQRFLQANADKLSEVEKKKFEIVATGEKVEDKGKTIQASSVKGDEGLVNVQASDIKAMKDSIDALQANEVKRDEVAMGAEVDKHIARGAIKADRKDSYVKRLLAANAADRDELLADLSALSDNPALGKTQGSDKTAGDAAADAEAELMKKAQDRVTAAVKDGKTLDLYTARKEVIASEPELAERAFGQGRAAMQATGQISNVTE